MSELPFTSGGGMRTFTARFSGICEDCHEGFEKGDEVRYKGTDLVHADSDDCLAAMPATAGAPCPECFMVHAGDCL